MSDATFDFTSRFLLAAADAAGVPREVLYKRVNSVMLRFTRKVDPTVTLEIGAFEAGFSLWVRENLPQARALAYEANPYVFERFRDEVTAAGVEYLNVAVGPESGPLTIHVPRDFRGGPRDRVNQMASLTTNLNTENHETVTVEGIRLDDSVKLGEDDRMVAWIDVEGALKDVLAGSRETLARASLVFIEVENTEMWEGQWLDTDVVAWFREIGLVPILRDFQRWWQYNLVFVSPELARDPEIVRLAARIYAPPVRKAEQTAQPLPAKVPQSRVGRLQGVLQRTLQAQNAELREQNKILRSRTRRLRRRVRELEQQVALLDEAPTLGPAPGDTAVAPPCNTTQ